MQQEYFIERQRFRQLWLWILLAGINTMVLYGIFSQFVLNKPFGNKPASNAEFIIVALLMIVITALLLSFRLETKIDREGIYYRFFPIHQKQRFISWDRISEAKVRHYKPILEYGGWGFRIGRNGNALNVSGNMGLQLRYDDTKRLLIGTRRPAELEAYLKQIRH